MEIPQEIRWAGNFLGQAVMGNYKEAPREVDSDEEVAVEEADDEEEKANSPMLSMSIVQAIGAMREGHGDADSKWGRRAANRRDRASDPHHLIQHALELEPLVYRRDDGTIDNDRIAQARLIAIGALTLTLIALRRRDSSP